MIGEMNRRVTVKRWGSVKDAGSGTKPILLNSWEVWAKVEDKSGSLVQTQDQRNWRYDTKITLRYDLQMIYKSSDTIDYENYRYVINSLSVQSEGCKKFFVARCTKSDREIDDTSVASIAPAWNYYGVGGETLVTANGSGMTSPNTNRDIRNKTIYGAYKDGIMFEVITSGSFTAGLKQVKYKASTGEFMWSVAFEPGEHGLIQYY